MTNAGMKKIKNFMLVLALGLGSVVVPLGLFVIIVWPCALLGVYCIDHLVGYVEGLYGMHWPWAHDRKALARIAAIAGVVVWALCWRYARNRISKSNWFARKRKGEWLNP